MKMKLPVYFISDNHFLLEQNKYESERRNKLFNLFDHIKETGGTLIIGGDFFDFWLQTFFGVPKYYDDLINNLKALNENKIEIHYIAGNHDFWDFGFMKKTFGCNLHKGDFIFKIKDHKMLITHGDGVLQNDSMYRFMKKIIRNWIFIFLIRLIPISIMTFFAKKISNSKNKLNPKYPELNKLLKNELEDYAFKKMDKNNINTLLMGHYHETGIIEKNKNKFIHLGDWLTKFTVTIFDENQTFTQKSWNEN
ncbi:MAG: UDP-2,3-diacylglucosamine diphosphatase [Pelagibacteraceae bacterium TMED246]|nr:MAG: UDP-2,3-diacylglucosamine diphosphatase [Pelagibacteraceae bacterium TMED246]|tara:strand:- start:63272 stop:64024 length:753 start_codon:yes stop_codon:yes gene_type:complete